MNKDKLIYKSNAIINFNYNKSLLYMLPEILKLILYYNNDLNTSRVLFCTSKIFHPLLSKLKTLKFYSDYDKHSIISINPLLPCFKSARCIMFIHFYFNKHIILKDFGYSSTNNVVCDVLLSKQYHEVSFIDCHIEPYIITYIDKNKSIQLLKLIHVDNFSDKYIFSCFMQHFSLNELYIAHTPFHLKFLTNEQLQYILNITNHFTNQPCRYLCQLFKKSKINKISLIHCGINDAYFLLYMTFFFDANIHFIDLSDNLITQDYDDMIYNKLLTCKKVMTIILSHNPICHKQITKWQNVNTLVTIIF